MYITETWLIYNYFAKYTVVWQRGDGLYMPLPCLQIGYRSDMKWNTDS